MRSRRYHTVWTYYFSHQECVDLELREHASTAKPSPSIQARRRRLIYEDNFGRAQWQCCDETIKKQSRGNSHARARKDALHVAGQDYMIISGWPFINVSFHVSFLHTIIINIPYHSHRDLRYCQRFFSFWVLPTWATCNTRSSMHRGGFSPFLITCYPLKLLPWTRPVAF